jgi:hypothetical protein
LVFGNWFLAKGRLGNYRGGFTFSFGSGTIFNFGKTIIATVYQPDSL